MTWKTIQYGAVCCEIHTSATRADEVSAVSSLPPPKKRRRGVFWKLLGLSVLSAGGVIGYAWYDKEFKKKIEDNVPYSKEAFSYIFEYLPESLPYLSPQPAVIQDKSKDAGPPVKKQQATVPTKDTAQVLSTPETAKERAIREAREKKEKAQELIRKREAEEAAQNLALETGLTTLLTGVEQSIQSAVNAQHTAAKAVSAHTDLLKKAMDADGTEDEWQMLTELQQTRADALWASEHVIRDAEEALDKLRQAIANGRENKTTKRNKILTRAEKELNKFGYELSSASAELTKAKSQSTVLTSYRDLVRKGQDQFSKELEQIVPGVKLGEKSGQLTTPELNSLIGHAHRRVDQLQREVIEQSAMEPLRLEAVIDTQRAKDERLIDENVAQERQRFSAEITKLHDAWEAEAKAKFEAELRQQLARQAAAHSDHLVSVLHAQRLKLEAEFEKQLIERVKAEKLKMMHEISAVVNRVGAIESAVNGRAERQRSGQSARELWVACRTLLSSIKDGYSVNAAKDELTPIHAELNAVRDAGKEYTIVHIALSTLSSEALNRGVYTPDGLRHRFSRVRRVARRVAMIDESGGTLTRYILSYIQSFFVLRSSVAADADDVSELSVFALLDNAANCLKCGDIEQAVRYVNQLSGEPRRVASEWLNEARILLETQQAAELLLAFASANGLGSLD